MNRRRLVRVLGVIRNYRDARAASFGYLAERGQMTAEKLCPGLYYFFLLLLVNRGQPQCINIIGG